MDNPIINNYIQNFISTFQSGLKPEVRVEIQISALPEQTLLCFKFGTNKSGSIINTPRFDNIRGALRFLGFSLDNKEEGRSEGTIVVLQGVKFAIIKDDNSSYWTTQKAEEDAKSILSHLRGSIR